MKEVVRLQAVIPPDFINKLRQRAEATLHGVYNDYFSQKSFEEFQSHHLGHTSLVMKSASYRFASAAILTRLKELIQPHVERTYGATDLLIHPIFYLRFSFPGIFYSDQHRAAFLDSQPHYDRSYGVDAFTLWIALDHIDEESGGLCSFGSEEILAQYPMGSKNRHGYRGYWDAAPDIDPILRRGTVAHASHAGDVLTFDSTVLHGGTKPRSRRRVSFDFRLVDSANLKGAPDSVRRIFEEVNTALDVSNANNLTLIDDFLGASRILNQVGAATDNRDLLRVASVLGLRPPNPAFLQEGAQMAWQNEYKWLT